MFNRKRSETPDEYVNESTPKRRPIPSPIRLGIWGFRGSGKSVYMLRLYEYLANKGKIQITDQDTEKYINDALDLFDKGIFVPPTVVPGKKTKYFYTIKNENGSNTELTFFDLSGEILENPYKTFVDENSQENTVVDYLLQCHGIIFLLSPLQNNKKSKPYHSLLRKLFIAMQSKSGQKPLEQYVAFGITKIDDPNVNQKCLEEKYHYPEQMFLEMLDKGPNVQLEWLKNFFHAKIDVPKDKSKNHPRLNIDPTPENRCQLFYISAFGTYKNSKGEVKSPVEENKQQDTASKAKFKEDPTCSTEEQDDREPYDFGQESINTKDIRPDTKDTSSDKYKIDINAPFNPINIFSPIEWLVRGIKNCPPNIPNHISASDSNT